MKLCFYLERVLYIIILKVKYVIWRYSPNDSVKKVKELYPIL